MDIKFNKDHIYSVSKLEFAKDKGVPEWIHLLPMGIFKTRRFGPIDLTDKKLDKMVNNFEKGIMGDTQLPINRDHRQEDSFGWIKALKKTAKGLWGKIDWTRDGEDLIATGKYKYISSEIDHAYVGDENGEVYGPTLFGAALTNYPYFGRQLKPIMASKNSKISLTKEDASVIYISGEDSSEKLNHKNNMTIKLSEIIAKDYKELSKEEIDYLKENKDKLEEDQVKKFAMVFSEEGEGSNESEQSEEENKEEDNQEENKEEDDNKEESGEEDSEDKKEEEEEENKEDDSEEDSKDDSKEESKDDDKEDSKMEASRKDEMMTLSKADYAKFQATAKELSDMKLAKEVDEKFMFSKSNPDGVVMPKGKEVMQEFYGSLNDDQRELFAKVVESLRKDFTAIDPVEMGNNFVDKDKVKAFSMIDKKAKEEGITFGQAMKKYFKD